MAISGTFSIGDEISGAAWAVFVDQTPDSSSFIAIESWSADVRVSGGDVPTTDFKTYTKAMVFTGEQNPWEIEIDFVYTEGANDPAFEIWDDFEANPGLDYDVRWIPSGNTSGNSQWTTSGGKLIACTPPRKSANDNGAIMMTIRVRAGALARTTAS